MSVDSEGLNKEKVRKKGRKKRNEKRGNKRKEQIVRVPSKNCAYLIVDPDCNNSPRFLKCCQLSFQGRHGLVLGMQTTSCIPSSSAHWDAFGAIWDASNIIFFIVGMRKYFSTICIPVVSAGWDAN